MEDKRHQEIITKAKARWPQLDEGIVNIVTTRARRVEFPCVMDVRGKLVMELDADGMAFAEGPPGKGYYQILVVKRT